MDCLTFVCSERCLHQTPHESLWLDVECFREGRVLETWSTGWGCWEKRNPLGGGAFRESHRLLGTRCPRKDPDPPIPLCWFMTKAPPSTAHPHDEVLLLPNAQSNEVPELAPETSELWAKTFFSVKMNNFSYFVAVMRSWGIEAQKLECLWVRDPKVELLGQRIHPLWVSLTLINFQNVLPLCTPTNWMWVSVSSILPNAWYNHMYLYISAVQQVKTAFYEWFGCLDW